MIIALIVACARNRAIGFEGRIPWHLPEDLKRFKKITSGHSILMGRKTFESIGRPLPKRRNIVISRKFALVEGIEVVDSFEGALRLCEGEEKVFVIGGEQIYRLALPLAHELYLTEVDQEVKGDAFFPSLESAQWEETLREPHSGYTFVDLRRVQKPAIKSNG